MTRAEYVCRKCRQVNVRHSGWTGVLINPLWPATCTLCGTNLQTGNRIFSDFVRGMLTWAAVYFLHAAVGVGVLTVGAALLWPNVINEASRARYVPMAVGLGLGLAMAEYSRRTGTLLARVKSGRQKKHRA